MTGGCQQGWHRGMDKRHLTNTIFICYIRLLYVGATTELFFIKISDLPTFAHCFSIQATTALAETTAIADFRSLTVFSAIYVVYCI